MKNQKLKIKYILPVVMILATGAYFFLSSIYVVPVVMYHKIGQDYKVSRLSVSPENFKKQMRFLRRFNYNVVSLGELAELVRAKRRIPYKTIAVTFDDGYKDNYTDAFAALKEYKIPACIFMPTGKVGKPGYLNWDELKEMSAGGIDIGSHTISECFLPDIKDEDALKKEIFESRNIIKSQIPRGGDFFAYCGGGFNGKIRQMVIDAGYKGAFATNPGKRYPKDDIYALKRLRVSTTADNLFVYWIVTSGFYTWIKEHRDKD